MNEPILEVKKGRFLTEMTPMYEGCATTFTLKAANTPTLTITASYNMWGDHKIEAVDN